MVTSQFSKKEWSLFEKEVKAVIIELWNFDICYEKRNDISADSQQLLDDKSEMSKKIIYTSEWSE